MKIHPLLCGAVVGLALAAGCQQTVKGGRYGYRKSHRDHH
jgi:hypothetical protein